MDNRRDLDVSFNELRTDQGREAFVNRLLQLDENNLREVLHDQHSLDHENLLSIMRFSEERHNIFSNPGFPLISTEISAVLSNYRHQLSYIGLSAGAKKSFLAGLLMLDAICRNLILNKQLELHLENIPALLENLTSDWIEQFHQYPSYSSLINDILDLQVRHQPRHQPIEEKKIVEIAEEPEVDDEAAVLLLPITTKSNGPSVNATIHMPIIMRKKSEVLFEDGVMLGTEITQPMITPQGRTYTQSSILQCLNHKLEDPIDRGPVTTDDLLPNHLFLRIKALFLDTHGKLKPTLDLVALQKLLTCPISGEPLRNPVVAEDGQTYEERYITAYLQSHNNTTPTNVTQRKPLYPNRFINDLYEQTHIDELIDTHLCARNHELEEENAALIQPLRQYTEMRSQEENYTGSWFGYCKWDKVIAPTHAIQVLTGRMSAHTFFSRHSRDASVLNQGRLQHQGGGADALEHIESMRQRRH